MHFIPLVSGLQVLAWLKCKTQRVVGCLVASGGVFAGMDRSAVELYAVGLLGEYLNPQLAAVLKAAYAQDTPGWARPVQRHSSHSEG